MVKTVQLKRRIKEWTVYIKDYTAHSVQSDLDPALSTKATCCLDKYL